MKTSPFSIVFKKILDAKDGQEASEILAIHKETDEIAELRKIVFEVTEPQPTYFTTT